MRQDEEYLLYKKSFESAYAKITYEHPNGDPIITNNPVTRLSQARIWNKQTRRQSAIKSHELSAWCKSVMGLENKTVRD